MRHGPPNSTGSYYQSYLVSGDEIRHSHRSSGNPSNGLSLTKQFHPAVNIDHDTIRPVAYFGIATGESLHDLVWVKVLRKVAAKCPCFLTRQVAVANKSCVVHHARFNKIDKVNLVIEQT